MSLHLTICVGKDINALMHNWVTAMGFPVLKVTESADGKSITVRQDRFLDDGEPSEKDNETIWYVLGRTA